MHWMIRGGCACLLFALGPTLVAGQARDPGTPAVEEAIQLAQALLSEHAHLLSPSQEEDMAAITEALKASGELIDGPGDDRVNNFAVEERSAAIRRLVGLLGSLETVVSVRVENGRTSTSVHEPLTLPGDLGAVILRVSTGDGDTRFATVSYDLSGPDDGVHVEVSGNGATWALIGLSNVPVGRSSLLFKLDGVIDRWIPLLLDVRSPERGRLKVTILSADGAKPTAAMIRLVSKTDRHSRKPSNAIEFARQFESQGNPTDPRQVNLPGLWGGAYWCIPGPFDMLLPPGEWDIAVRRGVEHIPVFDTISVRPGQLVKKTYRARRWVDMAARGWYSGDAHVHARMVSDSDAARIMTWAKAEDVHVVNVLKMGDISRTWFEQRGFGAAHRIVDGDYVLVPGQEDPRTDEQLGHAFALNTKSLVRNMDRYYLYDEIFARVDREGGLSGYAHVDRNQFQIERAMSLTVADGNVPLAEVMQFGRLGTELYYEFLNLGFKLTACAGSDVPWGGTIGEVRMYAHVGGQPFSPDAWFAAVKGGHTFVTNGPMLEFHVDDALPGDELTVAEDQVVRVRARAWGDPERMVPVKLDIVRHGEVLRSIGPPESDRPELTVEFDLPVGDGFWIAARAEGSDGSRAHTTPVYVVRPPLRFWAHRRVSDLIRQRHISLSEIEGVIATGEQLDRQGRVEYHRPWKQMALQ
ncbi:MAG: CehA/McbA family metallohydrolase, partial [Phycisphaerae bacterium]